MKGAWIIAACWLAAPVQGESHVLMAENPAPPAWQTEFRNRVSQCWNIGPLLDLGEVPAVTIAFEMTPEAKPIPESFELIESNAVTDEAEEIAFQSAMRAVRRCAQTDGYKLPAEKFEVWQYMQLGFAPEQSQLLTRPQGRALPQDASQ